MYLIHYTSSSKLVPSQSYNSTWREKDYMTALEHMRWNARTHKMKIKHFCIEPDGSMLFHAENEQLKFVALGQAVENDDRTVYVEDVLKK